MTNISQSTADKPAGTIGIIAGGGPLPVAVAQAVIKSGQAVFICALKDFGDPALEKFPHDWVSLGSVGRILKNFKLFNCRKIVMIGHVKRPGKTLLIPDLGALRNAKSLLKIARGGDDQMLSGVAGFLESKGFTVLGADQLIPESLIREGTLGRIKRDKADDDDDISKGFEVLNLLGKLDVGQAVVVSRGHVLAVEAAEGTDEMLKRVAKLRHEYGAMHKGGILVKGPKPNQDMRVDMPVIGPVTVELAAAAGLSGIVVQANGVLCHDRAALIHCADQLGVFIEGRLTLD